MPTAPDEAIKAAIERAKPLRVADLRTATLAIGPRRDYAVIVDMEGDQHRKATSVEWDDDARALVIRLG